MKKITAIALAVIMTAVLAVSADAAAVANHLFDKQGGIDAGGKTWSVYGWIVTDAEITSVGYILDNGDINSYKAVVTGIENDTRETASTKSGVSDAYRDLALEDAVKNGGMGAGVSWDILRAYRIQIVIDLAELEEGEHSVLLCVKFVEGGIAEAFRNQSEFSFKITGDGKEVIGGKGASTQFLVDSDNSDETKIAATGWAGSTVETVKLGYRIDNGETVYNENHVKLVPLDILEPGDAAVMDAAGVYAFRFKVNIPLSELPEGEHYIKLVMQDEGGGETIVGSSGGNEELMFYYEAEEAEETTTEAATTEAVTTTAETEAQTTTEAETTAETEAETTAETEAEATAETTAETEAEAGEETTVETKEETAAGTEADTADTTEAEPAVQSGTVTTEAVTTEENTKDSGKGLPAGAIIAIIVAAVAVIGVVVFIIIKKKK